MAVAQSKSQVNRELQRLGFGALKDPTLPAQFAMCVRDHAHFRGILMHIPEGWDRRNWYDAMIGHLRFTAKPLADYEMESKMLAERNQLPTYDPVTLKVEEFKPLQLDSEFKPVCRVCATAGQKYCLEHQVKEETVDATHASEQQAETKKLTARAEEAINRELRDSQAKIQNTLICHKCTKQQVFRMKSRRSLFKIAGEAGWFIQNLKAFCPDCKPSIQ